MMNDDGSEKLTFSIKNQGINVFVEYLIMKYEGKH
jgi:hypothetical protein